MKKSLTSRLQEHITDCTGNLVVTSPLFALFENAVLQFPDAVSRNARLLAAGVTYAGIGSLLSKGRDVSRRFFNIQETSLERKQWIHDTAFLMAANAVISPPFYVVAGANFEENLKGTINAVILGLGMGYLMGYGIDTFRDLFNIEPSSRKLSTYTRDFSSTTKKLVGIGMIAGSIGLHAAIYSSTQ